MANQEKFKTMIGGQALIEGILMKSPEKTAMAVRVPDGSIDVSFMNEKSFSFSEKNGNLNIELNPIIFTQNGESMTRNVEIQHQSLS